MASQWIPSGNDAGGMTARCFCKYFGLVVFSASEEVVERSQWTKGFFVVQAFQTESVGELVLVTPDMYCPGLYEKTVEVEPEFSRESS